MSANKQNISDSNSEYKNLNKTIEDLNKNIEHYQYIGYIGLTITVLLFIALSIFVYILFEDSLKTAKNMNMHNTTTTYNISPQKGVKTVTVKAETRDKNKETIIPDIEHFIIVEGEASVNKVEVIDNSNMVILAIFIFVLRTSLLGSFVLLSLIYTVKFTTSSFDQAVRFTKRKHASQFLLDMLNNHKSDILDIPVIMNAFGEWNVNVESAFTDVKTNEKSLLKFYEAIGKTDKTSK